MALETTNSLERALLLLETIEQAPGGLTNGELSQRFNIPRSTCSYILGRLERKGYLVRDSESGRYRVGLTVLALAYGALRDMGFRTIAEPALYRLASETGLSASIGVLERGRVLLVDRVESPEFVRNVVRIASDSIVGNKNLRTAIRHRELRDIGRELPVHSNALGKILLAYLSRAQVLAIIKERGLIRSTSKTITSADKLLAELELIRKQGYATSHEEQYPGIWAVGAPIFDSNGTVSAALSVTGSPDAAPWRDLDALVGSIKITARQISKRSRFAG